MSTTGSYTLILNEGKWIGPHLASWLPWLAEMVFYDGGSTDGTVEIIRNFQKNSKHGHKIKLFEDKNPSNLREAYVEMFDKCLHDLSTDLAIFGHPDMILIDPGNLPDLGDGLAYKSHMESFAGEPHGELLRINGRGEWWKHCMRLRNPDLKLHYFGFYGAANEDTYLGEITGDSHDHYGTEFHKYPYPVIDSGIRINHYSDVRTYERRLGRMTTCLIHQGHRPAIAEALAKAHPRVTLKNGNGFSFEPSEYPEIFNTWRDHASISVKRCSRLPI